MEDLGYEYVEGVYHRKLRFCFVMGLNQVIHQLFVACNIYTLLIIEDNVPIEGCNEEGRNVHANDEAD